jgi:Na+/melibiose symporter-like transporter
MILATSKGLGSSIIGIILSIVAAPTLLYFSHPGAEAADARGYFIFAVIISLAMIPAFWFCGWGCKEKYTEELHRDEEKRSFLESLKLVSKNDQLLYVVAGTVLGTICVTGRMGLLTYYIIYVVGDFLHIATVFTVMTVAQLIGTLCLPFLTQKLSKKWTLILLQGVMNITFLLMFLLSDMGINVILVLSFISGLCNAAANVCFGLVGDSLEYGAWKTGARMEGIAASMLSFGAKISTAICGAVGVLLLDAVGYVGGAEQTVATQHGINIIVNLIPMFVGILAIVPMLFYNLSPKRIEEIRDDLDNGVHAFDK